ncbi:hypothetical protein THAOC_31572, partial [Thalassiosira oceanica]
LNKNTAERLLEARGSCDLAGLGEPPMAMSGCGVVEVDGDAGWRPPAVQPDCGGFEPAADVDIGPRNTEGVTAALPPTEQPSTMTATILAMM